MENYYAVQLAQLIHIIIKSLLIIGLGMGMIFLIIRYMEDDDEPT
jgi:spermidine synthase